LDLRLPRAPLAANTLTLSSMPTTINDEFRRTVSGISLSRRDQKEGKAQPTDA
jgi:hypothetical protein